MSILAPLYLLGIAGIAAPILFHFFKRSPKGHVFFSTLRFLQPSPPKLTSRSRIDNLLLLILRALALLLIAVAFCRPFFRSADSLNWVSSSKRYVAIVVDTSASMRRGDYWQRTKGRVDTVLDRLDPGDKVALLSFDDRPKVLIDFEKGEPGTTDQEQGRGQQELVRTAMDLMQPSWQATNLGDALALAVETLESATTNDENSGQRLQIILVSDLQSGTDISALQGFDWPKDVLLTVEKISSEQKSNATLSLVKNLEDEDQTKQRVVITNDQDSDVEEFQLEWIFADDEKAEVPSTAARTYQIPRGQTRVVKIAKPEFGSPIGMRLSGDDFDFDNTFHIAPQTESELSIEFVGKRPAKPENGLFFYIGQIFSPESRMGVTAKQVDSDKLLTSNKTPELVIVEDALDADAVKRVEQYLESGGNVLFVASTPDAESTLSALAGDETLSIKEAEVKDYSLLGTIDFSHRLFRIFDDPKFNDFTNIHFWKHRNIVPSVEEDWNFVARFDNRMPAIMERTIGRGSLLVVATGWRPADGQLALSTKFVPMMINLVGKKLTGLTDQQILIGDSVNLSQFYEEDLESFRVKTPSQDEVIIAAKNGNSIPVDEPGIYELTSVVDQPKFAANLPTMESKTSELSPDQIEQLGVVLGDQPTDSEMIRNERQKRDVELEKQQRVWQWMIFAALGFLFLETVIGGVFASRQPA